MPKLSIEDVRAGGYDTVIVAAADVYGRLFGRRIPARRFLDDPRAHVDICTCAMVWDIAEGPDVAVPFAGSHTGSKTCKAALLNVLESTSFSRTGAGMSLNSGSPSATATG